MLNAKVLIMLFLTYPVWMKYVRIMLASEVNCCFSLYSWLRWMKLLDIDWNWSLSLITFSISFPIVLRRIIGPKALEELYNSLLGLGMMIEVETLKCKGQWSNSKHVSAILMIFFRHMLFLTIHLRYLHISLFGPKNNKLLHLLIELMNSALEKETQTIGTSLEISSKTLMSIWWSWAILKNK